MYLPRGDLTGYNDVGNFATRVGIFLCCLHPILDNPNEYRDKDMRRRAMRYDGYYITYLSI